MPKSVFQQLVEQTCGQANLKPSNNKAAQQPANGKPNSQSRSVSNPSVSVNEKRATSNEKPAAARSAVAELIAKQIRDMDAANRAPRCQHIKANGVQCKSPAMRELPFCFFHEKFYNPPYDDSFPPLEDENSVQCAILQVLNGLKTKAITLAEARVMLYGLKAASINARRTTFEPIMQAQVIEYPSVVRKTNAHHPSVGHGSVGQRFSAGSQSDSDCEPERAKRDQTSPIEEFLRAAKEQSRSAGAAVSNEVVLPSPSGANGEGPAFDCPPEVIRAAKPPASVSAARSERKSEHAALTSN